MSIEIGPEGAVTGPAVDAHDDAARVHAKAGLVGCEAGNAWEEGATKTATSQTKQARPPGRGTLRQRHNDALHSDACSSHIFHLHCSLQLELALRWTILIRFSCLHAHYPALRPRCSPGSWALRPSRTRAPTSQQVIPATPPIAICRQTVYYSRPWDAPRLLLRVEDIIWPFAHRRLLARSKSWDKHLGGPPINTITVDARVHRRVHLDFHSFCTLTRRLRPHYHYYATPGSYRPASTLFATLHSLTTPSNRHITHDHNTAHTTTWRDAAQQRSLTRRRTTMELRHLR